MHLQTGLSRVLGLVKAAPWIKSVPEQPQTSSGDKQMWLWSLAFGKNTHCHEERYKPGQGISCTTVEQACKCHSSGKVVAEGNKRAGKARLVWTYTSRPNIYLLLSCLLTLNEQTTEDGGNCGQFLIFSLFCIQYLSMSFLDASNYKNWRNKRVYFETLGRRRQQRGAAGKNLMMI